MKKKNILILGDMITFAIVTFIGFASHGEADVSYLPRFFATFLPLVISWFLFINWFELFNNDITSNPKLLWRVPLAMIFIAPSASILRSAWLGNAALPIFTLILGITNALGMFIWRWIYVFIAKNKIS